jgi:DNA repair and recombination protein RAD52
MLSKNNVPNIISPQKPSNPPELEPLVGFFSSKVADSIQNNRLPPPNVPLFNPKAESPSIRKTQGVDHTKTKPIHRETLAAPTNNPMPQMRSNFVHPQADQTRRIGAPTSASPLQNRGSYKPPHMNKRPLEGNTPQ